MAITEKNAPLWMHTKLGELMIAMEFGFNAHERGWSKEQTVQRFKQIAFGIDPLSQPKEGKPTG